MSISTVRIGYGLIVAVLALMQIALGVQIAVLAPLLLVAGTAYVPLARRQMRVTDALFLGFILYYSVGALVLKSILGQPLQSNLDTPGFSSAYLLIGFFSIFMGYLAANALPIRNTLIGNTIATFDSTHFLRIFSRPAFFIGTGFDMLHSMLRSNAVEGSFDSGGFGGFGGFHFFLVAGLAGQATLWARNPKDRVQLGWLLLFGATTLAMAASSNVKKTFIEFILVFIISIFACRVKLRPQLVVGGVLVALLMGLYVQPVITIVRPLTNELSPIERIEKSWEIVSKSGFDPVYLNQQADKIAYGYAYSYSESYLYPSPMMADRFAMISPIDGVASRIDQAGTMGIRDIIDEIKEHVLPSILVVKTNEVTADRIAWHYGIRVQGVIARPVIGLVASAIAAYGLPGVILLPGLTIFAIFALINLLGSGLTNSAWASFLLMVCLFFTEKEIAPDLAYMIREIPLSILSIMAITHLYRHFLLPEPGRRNVRAAHSTRRRPLNSQIIPRSQP